MLFSPICKRILGLRFLGLKIFDSCSTNMTEKILPSTSQFNTAATSNVGFSCQGNELPRAALARTVLYNVFLCEGGKLLQSGRCKEK